VNTLRALWASIEGDPAFMQKLHARLTVTWLLASIPVCIWAFYDPENRWLVPILIFVSFYANTSGHWSSWQAARVETKQEEIEEKRQEESESSPNGEADHDD
jgi:hypothetical protein